MLNITIDYSQIAGAARAMAEFPEKLKKNLRAAMVWSQREVLKESKDRVHVVTGTLRRSISAPAPEENSEGGWTGRVGTNVRYAAMEEFGYSGPQQVRAHIRHSAFGRETKPFSVRAHVRTLNRKEHPYLRPALAAARDEIIRLHTKAISDTAKESKP